MKVFIVEVWSNEGTEELEVFQSYKAAANFGLEAIKEDKTWFYQVIEREVK